MAPGATGKSVAPTSAPVGTHLRNPEAGSDAQAESEAESDADAESESESGAEAEAQVNVSEPAGPVAPTAAEISGLPTSAHFGTQLHNPEPESEAVA